MTDPIENHPELADLAAPDLSEPERMRAAAMRLRRVADIPGLHPYAANVTAQLSTALTLVSQAHERRGQCQGCMSTQIAAAILGGEVAR